MHTELNDWHRGYAFSSLYDQRQEVAQWDTDNKPYRNLNYLPNEEQGLPYGTLISQSVPQWQKSEFRATGHSRNLASKAYYHQDRQGSTIKVTVENSSNSYRWDYTPFGEAYGFENRYSHSSNSPQRDLIPYLYTGKYQTSLTGLIDMDARWYNPQVGRFIQPDYYNFAQLALPNGARNKLLATTSLNTQMLLNDPSQQMRYGYVSGNPMRWVDPMGLCYPEAHGVEPISSGGGIDTYQYRDGSYYDVYNPQYPQSNYRPLTEKEHLVLDVGGTLDPSPLTDIVHSITYLREGRLTDTGLTFAGILPIAGDGAKVLKYGDGTVDVYRAFGGDARAQGFSWTTKDPRKVDNFRDASGLPSGGASGATNTADFLIKGKANASDIIKSRSALPLDGNKGGLPELIIDPKNVNITDFSVLKP